MEERGLARDGKNLSLILKNESCGCLVSAGILLPGRKEFLILATCVYVYAISLNKRVKTARNIVFKTTAWDWQISS